MSDTYKYILVRIYDEYVGRTSPLGYIKMFDDFQIVFDPDKRQIRINLSEYDLNHNNSILYKIP